MPEIKQCREEAERIGFLKNQLDLEGFILHTPMGDLGPCVTEIREKNIFGGLTLGKILAHVFEKDERYVIKIKKKREPYRTRIESVFDKYDLVYGTQTEILLE